MTPREWDASRPSEQIVGVSHVRTTTPTSISAGELNSPCCLARGLSQLTVGELQCG